ncbi:hypothetical protein [Streptomyces anulatus]|uniref:hypothetical protein n=1 Tax=Streptomyces anulatus TaxID=1892 RepID=UPI00386BB641
MAADRATARSCADCLVWVVLNQRGACAGCRRWRQHYRERGTCPRCQHERLLNSDGLCRSCLQAIRLLDDAEWALGIEGVPPRDLQLTVGVYHDRADSARQLSRAGGTGPRTSEVWNLRLRQQRAGTEQRPAVLEPGAWGQIPLFTIPRTLTADTARAVAGRPVPEWEKAQAVLEEIAAEQGLSRGTRYRKAALLRLALAVRAAEGTWLLPEVLLRDLPAGRITIRLVLQRAGLLASEPEPLRPFPAARRPPRTVAGRVPWCRSPRSCADCQAWVPSGPYGSRCAPCRHWREKLERGTCARCHRQELPLRKGRCRGCRPYRLLDGAQPTTSQYTQLLIDVPISGSGPPPPIPVDEPPHADLPPAPAHTAAGQEQLFAIRRDWPRLLSYLQGRNTAELVLTGTATRLVEDFSRVLHERQSPSHNSNIRTLSIILYWCGAQAAISERDVHDLARTGPDLKAKTVCQFLRDRGILLQDPDLHRDVDLTWIDTTLAALPELLAEEVGQWVTVQRSQGRHEGGVRGYDAFRPYLASLQPVLTAWAEAGLLSLREITRQHIDAAVTGHSGRARRQLALALRSLFRTLKRERVVFRDPAQHLRVGSPTGIPKPVPSDLLANALQQTKTPLGRLILVLAAVHAVPVHELRTILTCDLDLARGTLDIRRGLRRHTLYLEELTHQLAADWLDYRHRRWPASTNPRLIVSQRSALDPDHPAVGKTLLRDDVPPGLTLVGLRQDRILNEAAETADPLRLMRLFGIGEKSAMHYVTTAHPERTAKLPR